LLEKYWGKKYGYAMIIHAIETIKNMKFNEVIIWVLEDNHRARRFYENVVLLLVVLVKNSILENR